jgi:hypothetical protein
MEHNHPDDKAEKDKAKHDKHTRHDKGYHVVVRVAFFHTGVGGHPNGARDEDIYEEQQTEK